jgi:hypothetical protein
MKFWSNKRRRGLHFDVNLKWIILDNAWRHVAWEIWVSLVPVLLGITDERMKILSKSVWIELWQTGNGVSLSPL